MLRPELVRRKLQLIAQDLELLLRFEGEPLEDLVADHLRVAALERILERIVMRAIDVNEHLISALATGEGRTTRLSYRDTFLMLADLGVCPREHAERIARSAGLRNILVHDYNDVDHRMVHGAVHDCLVDYHDYAEHVERFLGGLEGAGRDGD